VQTTFPQFHNSNPVLSAEVCAEPDLSAQDNQNLEVGTWNCGPTSEPEILCRIGFSLHAKTKSAANSKLQSFRFENRRRRGSMVGKIRPREIPGWNRLSIHCHRWF